MTQRRWFLLISGLLSLGLMACQPFQAGLERQATRVAAQIQATLTLTPPTHTPSPTSTPIPTATMTSTATHTPTPPAGPLSVADLFALVSPSIVFIETPSGTGSGVLVEDGYIVTNAHVIWPYDQVRIVFPDGQEQVEAPVLNQDLMADLAIVGPVETKMRPLPLVDGEALTIGSEVYLIGYPGEGEQFPQPTISRGLISRLREWDALGITYFQTDAAVAGGQSGGVLVSERGEVIGISTFSFADTAFALVASAADVRPRIEQLIAGDDVDGLGKRHIPLSTSQREYTGLLENSWDTQMFILNEIAGTEIDLHLAGENDFFFFIVDQYGEFITYADDYFSGPESGSITIERDLAYFVVVGQMDDAAGNFRLSSDYPLARYQDADDGQRMTVGETMTANMDYPFDFDYFIVQLQRGEVVEIVVDSITMDPVLTVSFIDAAENEEIQDDDSGGGPFGVNAKLIYEAPHSGNYLIIAEDHSGYNTGGYLLSIAPALVGAVPAELGSAEVETLAQHDTPFGAMTRYRGQLLLGFSMDYPSDWIEYSPTADITARFVDEQLGGALSIVETDIVAEGFGKMAQTDYVSLIISILAADLSNFRLISREPIETEQGLSATKLVYTERDGVFTYGRLIYVVDQQFAFNATYFGVTPRYEALEMMIDYSFSTFQVAETW